MEREERSDRFTALEDRFSGYEVYDRNGQKIGKVDDLFVDENDQPEYIGVKMGFLGTRSTLIPMEIAQLEEASSRITVSADKETVKDGPTFDDDREITPEYEDQVHSYYGLDSLTGTEERGSEERGSYEAYSEAYSSSSSSSSAPQSGAVGRGMTMGDTESGEFREHGLSDEGLSEHPGSDLDDEDELRVKRSEEELRVGTRERQAGALNVRKRVLTERQSVEVPTKREEVRVERVPVEGEASSEAQEIGDEEVRVPVTEEEVVVEKRPVAKEEVRIRKDVVEDTEVVEEDVRKEEVDVDDRTERRTP